MCANQKIGRNPGVRTRLVSGLDYCAAFPISMRCGLPNRALSASRYLPYLTKEHRFRFIVDSSRYSEGRTRTQLDTVKRSPICGEVQRLAIDFRSRKIVSCWPTTAKVLAASRSTKNADSCSLAVMRGSERSRSETERYLGPSARDAELTEMPLCSRRRSYHNENK